MSNIVPAFSTRQFTLTAGEAIAVWSQGAFKVTQLSGFVNFPTAPIELVDRAAGGLVFTSSTLTNGGVMEVDCYGGMMAYVEDGTAPVVKQGQYQTGIQKASTAQDATGTLTATQLLNGRITSTGVTNPSVLTVPTGTLLLAASTWQVGEYFDWSVLNTGANVVNLAAGTDHTLVGGAGAAISVATLVTAYLRTTLVSVSGVVGTFTTEALARPVT